MPVNHQSYFDILNCTIDFFVDNVNQLTIAKLDKFSSLHFFERVLELRFKYLGSYLGNKFPQLTIHSFAIINLAQAMIEDHDCSNRKNLLFC